jgi:peptide/nickel transport system permease protein
VLRTVGLKLAQIVPVMFVVSVATFLLLELVPGDPAATIAGENATPEQIEGIRQDLNLDDPLVTRYVSWLGDTLTGDLGQSLQPPNRSVTELLQAVLPVTLQVAAMALLIALVVAVPAALLSANRPNATPDRLLSAGAFGAISLPSFLTALLLIFFLVFHRDIARWAILLVGVGGLAYLAKQARAQALRHPEGGPRRKYSARAGALFVFVSGLLIWLVVLLPDFPRQGFSRITADEGLGENLRSAFLPALALAATEAAVWMRLLRGDLITTLQEDYVLAARAKGMPRWRVLVLDALRPASFSLITVVGVSLGRALGGTVIVEQIFNLPGMGTMMVDAILDKDLPVVQGAVLLIAVVYVLINAVVDVGYGYLDPRVRRRRV